ncbi:hypothetical protein NP777_09375 [Streptomyces sp. RCU064]|uniref:Uncharacterized protein n=1 Tax=Streptomyces rugosispiralis TaxID=2967341 RepID=A0ABT1UTK8_9ACTN|nr:hypothetical protein [Streptomyces rugosispiralis]
MCGQPVGGSARTGRGQAGGGAAPGRARPTAPGADGQPPGDGRGGPRHPGGLRCGVDLHLSRRPPSEPAPASPFTRAYASRSTAPAPPDRDPCPVRCAAPGGRPGPVRGGSAASS